MAAEESFMACPPTTAPVCSSLYFGFCSLVAGACGQPVVSVLKIATALAVAVFPLL
jgi:hypothetical protein